MALDQFGNTAIAYTGTVHFTSTDLASILPADSTLTDGTGTFTATLKTPGLETLTATDTVVSLLTGTSNTVAVSGAATHFAVSAPVAVKAGTLFTFLVTALDSAGNIATGYTGTVHISSSDHLAILLGDTTLTAGFGTFAASIQTPGSQTLTATDTLTASIAGTTTLTVTSNPATHFTIFAPTSTVAGSPTLYEVTALDSLGNIALGYNGTVHFASSDTQAFVPADATLTGGIGYFAAVLRTAGSDTLTAVDSGNSAITGSATIAVSAASASHFAVSAPAYAVTGTPFLVTVTAEDAFGNTAADYRGTVQIGSSDTAAAIPPNSTLMAGVGVFTVTLKSPGSQTITATDTTASSLTGTSNGIVSRGLTVASLTPTSTGFVATFDKPFNPTLLDLYDASIGGGIDDVLLTGPNAPQISFHGSLIISPNDQTITFVKTSNFTGPNFNPSTGVLAAGTYTVTFRSGSTGFVDSFNGPLDGADNGNPAGSNYVATFVVSAPPVVVGIPAFARGPDSVDAINLPNSATTGIPLNLSVGSGVTSGTFTLTYNAALLSISGAAVNTSLPGASLSLDAASTPGTAILDFTSPTALTASTAPVRLGGLVATVPNSAASLYKSKALLHWSSVTLNGGAIAAVGDDSVEVVAYFGDASGSANGSLSGGDASDISAVATGMSTNSALGTLAGFSAFPLADPVIIADLNNDGLVDASDVTLLNSVLAGTSRPQIPTIPTNVPITAYGPDPALSLPTNLPATPGAKVIVPVNIDTAHPFGSTGAVEAILALQYNPQVLTVSPADVQLGSLTAGWQLTTMVNPQTGEIGIDIFSTSPIQTTAGGSLVTITVGSGQWAVGSSAESAVGLSPIWLVNQVDPTGHRVFTTTVADSQGAFVLHFNSGQAAEKSGQWAVDSGQLENSGQCAIGSGQLTQNKTTLALGETASDMQFTAQSPLLTAHYLDLVLQEMAFEQPAPLLTTELDDEVLADTHALTGLIQANGVTQTDWTADHDLAYLRQSSKLAAWALGIDGFDGQGDDETD